MTSSMNDSMRVVVSPSFPIEWRDVDDFLGEFGPFNGRYVPRYPNDWLEKLRHHLDDIDLQKLPPRARAALFERLRREIMLCTIPVGWSWDDSKSWERNVEEALSGSRGSIVVGDALDPSPYKNWSHEVGNIKRTRSRTWHFRGLVSDYVSLCLPLLVNSPAAYLVDPYFDPLSEKFEHLLVSLFDAIKGSKCYRLGIIARQSACGNNGKKDAEKIRLETSEIENSLKRIYGHRIPKDRSLVLYLVHESKKDEQGLTMHDRFFLTNHGAISFGYGFEVANQNQSMRNAFVVDKNHHALLKEVYINGVARHSEKLPKVANVAYPKGVTPVEITG